MRRFFASRWGGLLVGGGAAAALAAAVAGALLRRPTLPLPPPPAGPITLHEVSRESGIAFQHTDGSSGQRYIMEAMSAGLATFDYDGDGLIDVYFVNGAPPCRRDVRETPAQRTLQELGRLPVPRCH